MDYHTNVGCRYSYGGNHCTKPATHKLIYGKPGKDYYHGLFVHQLPAHLRRAYPPGQERQIVGARYELCDEHAKHRFSDAYQVVPLRIIRRMTDAF